MKKPSGAKEVGAILDDGFEKNIREQPRGKTGPHQDMRVPAGSPVKSPEPEPFTIDDKVVHDPQDRGG